MNELEVTLKQLRENQACIDGYNKVVCSLKNIEYKEQESYIKYKHDEPISLLFILESNGLDDTLWCLRCNKEWDRDSRLFAVWCARQVQHLMTDERSLRALDVAEAFANGEATLEELEAAGAAAWAAADAASRAASRAAGAAADAASRAASRAAARSAAWAAAWAAAGAARDEQKEMFIKMCNGQAPWQVKGE